MAKRGTIGKKLLKDKDLRPIRWRKYPQLLEPNFTKTITDSSSLVFRSKKLFLTAFLIYIPCRGISSVG